MRVRVLSGLAVVIVGAAGAGRARAEVTVVEVGRGRAQLTYEQTFANDGAADRTFDESIRDLPPGAFVDALAVRSGGVVTTAGLASEAVAEGLFEQARGSAACGALLAWSSASELGLRVGPLKPHARATVTWRAEAPLAWTGGRFVLPLPTSSTRLSVRARDPRDRVAVAGDTIELAPFHVAPLEGEFASIDLGEAGTLWSGTIRAAPRLSTLPSQPSVLLVVDRSRSFEERPAALAAIEAYLEHLPEASVAALTFDREVHAATPGFVSRAEAVAALRVDLERRRNGSDLAAALTEAAATIEKTPSERPRRVVVISDLRLASDLDPEITAARRLFPKDVIVHFAIVAKGEASVHRDDDHPWAKVPRSTGGLLFRAFADVHDRTGNLAPFEDWARPLRFDRIVVRAAGKTLPFEIAEQVAEGEAIDFLEITEAAKGPRARSIEISAELWSRPSRIVIESDDASERFAAGRAIAEDDGLAPGAIEILAARARAVSPSTSLVVAPSRAPAAKDWSTFGASYSCGTKCGISCMMSTRPSTPNLRAFLAAAIENARVACKLPAARVAVETTDAEIVAVSVRAENASAASRRCLEESIWDLEPPKTSGDGRFGFLLP
jgi:hypothetical protein